MDWLTFFTKLIEYLAWPVAVTIVIFNLRSPLSDLIGKIESVVHGKSKVNFRSQQSQEKLETPPVNIPIPTDAVGMQQDYEGYIRRDLEAAVIEDPVERENILVSHLASTQINASYERVNSTIFGSQVDLLRALNGAPEPASRDSFKPFYDGVAVKYKDFYKTYEFEKYFDYLVNMGLLVQEGDRYVLSKLGKGYLIYIAEKGLTGFRHY